MKLLRTSLFVLACAAAPLAFAQWQWVDKTGRKVYSDQAPPPQFSAFADENVAAPYLARLKMTHNYHFVSNRPGALRWQQAMVVAQSALSVVILAAAALIGVSFARLVRVPVGFQPRNLVVARLNLQATQYEQAPQRVRFGRELLENLSREPAIAGAAFTSTLPVSDVLWGPHGTLPLASRLPAVI